MSFPQDAVLHLGGRPLHGLAVVHDGQPVDVPCQPCGDESKYDDKEQGAVHVGKALHLGGRLVYPGRLGEPAPGIHLPLVAFLVFRVVPVRHLLTEQHASESFDVHGRASFNNCSLSSARCPCSVACASSR